MKLIKIIFIFMSLFVVSSKSRVLKEKEGEEIVFSLNYKNLIRDYVNCKIARDLGKIWGNYSAGYDFSFLTQIQKLNREF